MDLSNPGYMAFLQAQAAFYARQIDAENIVESDDNEPWEVVEMESARHRQRRDRKLATKRMPYGAHTA
jgi:hypothetical protein